MRRRSKAQFATGKPLELVKHRKANWFAPVSASIPEKISSVATERRLACVVAFGPEGGSAQQRAILGVLATVSFFRADGTQSRP